MTTSNSLTDRRCFCVPGAIFRADFDVLYGQVTVRVAQLTTTGRYVGHCFTAHYNPRVTDVTGFMRRLDRAMCDRQDDLLALFEGGVKWTVVREDPDQDPPSEPDPTSEDYYRQQEDRAIQAAYEW